MTSRHWLALAIVGSGIVSLGSMALYAKGKREEAFALAFTSGILSTVFSAARVLNEDNPAPSWHPAPPSPAGPGAWT